MAEDDKQGLYLMKRTFTFHRWSFSLREVVLAGGLVLGVLFFLLFAGLYGQESAKLDTATAKLAGIKPKCSDLWCLETAAHAKAFLNGSANPCDNFFQFACGGFKEARKLDPGRDLYLSVLQELYQSNKAVLENILVSGVSPRAWFVCLPSF